MSDDTHFGGWVELVLWMLIGLGVGGLLAILLTGWR